MTTEVPPAADDRRPDSPAHRVDAACDRFEAAWRGGQDPRIEDFLDVAAEPERPALLRQLIALEVELRRDRGEHPTPGEYHDRFPGQPAPVDAAFAETALRPGRSRPRTTQSRGDTGRNLLFGILALQNNFIGRDDLLAAFAAWVADKARPLAQLLVDRGALDDVRRALLEALVAEHLKQHGGDPEASLAAVSSLGSVRDDLCRITDPDLQAGIAAAASQSTGPGGDAGATATLTSSSRRAGERFRIVRFHREGGLGRVYLARDEELGREVALKEIRPDKVAQADLRDRFVLEAEINGGLEHPGIVPVYSLGSYGDGRPFYAMRFVVGDSLKEAIESYHKECPRPDPTAVEFRKLLGRFVDVCEAIAFAHSKGVLHRDLKPHNVMLGRFGETLLIDWGLAKATGRREPVGLDTAPEATLVPPSGSGHAPTLGVLGSPPYMSPEQAAGEAGSLGPATDVYGLGAILFALLTGEPPVNGGTVDEVLERVRRGAIRSPRSLNPSIPRALEAVCLKALAPKPGDRYATALALAEEVEHWLADEPVSARRDPFVERARRWMRRRRTAVTATAAAVLVALVGLAALLAVQSRANRDLRAANDRERARFDLAMSAIKTFHTGVSEDFLLKQPAHKELRTELLRGAGEFYRELGEQLGGQADERSRAALGEAYFELAKLMHTIGSRGEAESAFEQALAIRRRLAEAHPAVAEYQSELARSLNSIGNMRYVIGRTDEALRLYEQARAIRQGLVDANPADAALRRDLATSQYNIGHLLRATGHPMEALQSHEAARAIRQGLADANPADTQIGGELVASCSTIGRLRGEIGQTDEALRSYEKGRAIAQRLIDAHPTRTEFQSHLAYCLHGIGNLLWRTGRPREALGPSEAALAIWQKLADANPAVTEFQNQLAWIHNNIGLSYADSGRPEEAIASYEKGRTIRQKMVDAHPADPQFRSALAFGDNNIGLALIDTGRPEEALPLLEKGRAIWRELADANPAVTEYQREVARSDDDIGDLRRQAGRTSEALQSYERARAIQRRLAEANPTVTLFRNDLARSHNSIGLAHLQAGRPEEAMRSLEEARAIRQGLAEANPSVPGLQSDLAGTLHDMAVIDAREKRLDSARARLVDAVRYQRVAMRGSPQNPTYRPPLRNYLSSLARADLELRDPAGAAGAAREMAELSRDDPRGLYDAAGCVARCAPMATGRSEASRLADEAFALLKQAVATGWVEAARPAADPDLASLHDRDDYRRLVSELFDRVFPVDPFARGN